MTVVVVTLVLVLLVVSAGLVTQTGRVRHERDRRLDDVQILEARLARNNELEAQLASSLDAIHLGVVLKRRDGTTVFRNRAAERYVAARHGHALIEATVDELHREALGGTSSEREVELYGPPMNVHRVRGFPLFAGDDREPVGALVLVEDVTDGRRVDHIRRDFVANISHELRTPIGAIGLLAETIVDEDDPATVRRFALRMTDEADRVARTIDDLMELTRIEFGDDLATDDLAFGSIVDDAVDRIRSGADLNGVSIDVGEVERGLELRGDRRQLTSAIYNLLDNAVKYSPAGSTVEVRSVAAGDRLVIEVADQGVGIPARDLDRIFERFYRVDRARSRVTGGTGLGLAIVRHVVANHDGDVTVVSREGEGSTFRLDLPRLVGSSEASGPREEIAH